MAMYTGFKIEIVWAGLIRRVKEARREEPRCDRPQHTTSSAEQWGREFEAKRKKVADKSSSTVRSILKITRDPQNSTSHLPDEAAQAQKDFNQVLQKWKHSASADIWRQTC
nr:unnamed protein product [Spirometra erinaceieuropaei]